MKLFSTATLLAVLVSTAESIIVNTPPSVVECEPLLITWDPQGSPGPFFLSVVPGNSPSSPALFSWSGLNGTSFTWLVTEPSGTSLGLLLRDQTGATSQSAPFIVQPGMTSSCLNSTSSVSIPPASSLSSSGSLNSTSTSTTTTTTTKPPTSTTTTTTKPPTSTPTPPPRSSTTSSPAPSSSGNSTGNSKGEAYGNTVNLFSAGLLAFLVGAILA